MLHGGKRYNWPDDYHVLLSISEQTQTSASWYVEVDIYSGLNTFANIMSLSYQPYDPGNSDCSETGVLDTLIVTSPYGCDYSLDSPTMDGDHPMQCMLETNPGNIKDNVCDFNR